MITLNRRDGSSLPARAPAGPRDHRRGQGGAHLPEHPPVLRHDAAGEPAGRPAQQADEGVRLSRSSACSASAATGKASAESIELAKHWLEKAELVDRADDPAGDLPYGAQRRLEIARAMCTGPGAAVPRRAGGRPQSAGIGWRSTRCCNDIKDNTGTSILLIEHDMSVVMQISDHVVVLEYGRKISDGNPHIGEDRSARHRRLSRRRRRGGRDGADRSRRRGRDRAAGRRSGLGAWTRHVGLDDGRSGDRHDRPQRRRARHGVEGRLEGSAGRCRQGRRRRSPLQTARAGTGQRKPAAKSVGVAKGQSRPTTASTSGDDGCQPKTAAASQPRAASAEDVNNGRHNAARYQGRRDLLRQHPRAERRRCHGQPGRDRRADRRQRRRQVDADDDHLRQPARPRAAPSASPAPTSRRCRRTRSRACASPSRRRAAASSRA